MLTLAIDTATKVCTIALCRDKEILAEYTINMGMTHSEGLLPQLDQLLQRAGVQKQDIELLAVSMGPGSFTAKATELPLGIRNASGATLIKSGRPFFAGNGRGYGLQLAVLPARS